MLSKCATARCARAGCAEMQSHDEHAVGCLEPAAGIPATGAWHRNAIPLQVRWPVDNQVEWNGQAGSCILRRAKARQRGGFQPPPAQGYDLMTTTFSKTRALLSSCFFVAALGITACHTDDKKPESPFAPAPDPNEPQPHDVIVQKPWTLKFVKSAVLVAQDVHVEGPEGLLEHFVTRQELDVVDLETKTTPDGLLQTFTLKPGLTNGDIRGQLDNLAITCMHRLEVLERPGHVPVVVQANGDVFYQEAGAEMPTRGASLRFVGEIQK